MFSTPSRPTAGSRRTGGTPQSSRASTPSRAFSPPVGGPNSGGDNSHDHRTSTPPVLNRRALPSHVRASVGPANRTRSVLGGARLVEDSERAGALQLEEGSVLSKDDVFTVTAFSRMPAEVLSALAGVDLYIDPLVGSLDVNTGHALLASKTACYVWSFARQRQRQLGSPICFSFSIASDRASTSGPDNSQISRDVPFCHIVANVAGREPGLVAVSATGEVMYWETLSASVGASGKQTTSIALGAGERVVTVQMCESHLYAIGTTHSRLLRLSLVSQNGRLAIQTASFTQPRGIFGALFGSSAGFGSGSDITAIATCPKDERSGSRDLYAVGRNTLQKWRVREGASEKLLMEQDVRQLIASSVFGLNDDIGNLADQRGLSLLHAATLKNGQVALLFSHQAGESLGYGIVNLDLPSDAKSFVLTNVVRLQYTSRRDPRPYGGPRLCIPYGIPAYFIVFADTLVVNVPSEQSTFEETVSLKDTGRNRFLGFGAEAVDSALVGSVVSISCMTVRSGSILVEVDLEAASVIASRELSPAERQSSRTERLEVKLEQAVFYGQQSNNPLAFTLPPVFEGDLNSAAQMLSHKILISASADMPTFVDTRAQLTSRLGYLEALIAFIDASGLLPKFSQGSRRALRSDAELAAAAIDLWSYQNEYMRTETIRGNASQSPLALAIEEVMNDAGNDYKDDLLRTFFGKQMPRIAQVLDKLHRSLKTCETATLAQRSAQIGEINTIALTIFQAAHRHRRENAAAYIIDSTPVAFEPWTAKAACIELLESLYHFTENVISERSRELGSSVDAGWTEYTVESNERTHEQRLQQTLKAHQCDLAEAALMAYEERLRYLRASSAERDCSLVEINYRRARQEMIIPLLNIGRQERAFALAEYHHDFHTLTELCTQPNTSGTAARVQLYLEKYRERFAFCLYQWYVEKGQTRALLEQADQHADLLTEFLRSTDNSAISWLHDIREAGFKQASTTLCEIATSTNGIVSEKKLMLSLGKLAYAAELDEVQLASANHQQDIELIDDQLDLVRVHDDLVRYFLEFAPDNALTEQAAIEVTKIVATKIQEYAMFPSHYASLVKNLLAGVSLSSEDLIDALTLKDTPDERLGDLGIAIEVLIRSKDLPEARFAAAVRATWRRILLRDDWASLTDTTSVSDEDVRAHLRSTALYRVLRDTGENLAEEEVKAEAFNKLQAQGSTIHPVRRPPPFPLLLSPAQTMEPPSFETIEGRLRGSPQQRLQMLLQDYETECEAIRLLLEQPVSLERWWHEVRRLVDSDEEGETSEYEGVKQQGGSAGAQEDFEDQEGQTLSQDVDQSDRDHQEQSTYDEEEEELHELRSDNSQEEQGGEGDHEMMN